MHTTTANRILLATASALLVSIVCSGAALASPDAGPTPYEFLLTALADANQRGILTDAVNETLADLFIEYLIAPETNESPEEVMARLTVRGQPAFELLLATLGDAYEKGLLTDMLSELLSDLFIEYLIAPHTGETPEMVIERLRAPHTPPSEQTAVPAWEWVWMKDGITGYESFGIDDLRDLQSHSPAGFEELIRKSWIQDDLTWPEIELIRDIREMSLGQKPRSDELIVKILKMPFLDSFEDSDLFATESLSWLARINQDLLYRALSGPLGESGITDEMTTEVPIRLIGQYDKQVAEGIGALSWVEDGMDRNEEIYAVTDLQILAEESRDVYLALIDKAWMGRRLTYDVRTMIEHINQIAIGEERDPRSALNILGMPFLDSLQTTDVQALGLLLDVHLSNPGSLGQFLSDPRLGGSVTDGSTGVLFLIDLEKKDAGFAKFMWSAPWIADGIADDEALYISKIAELAVAYPSLAMTVVEFANSYAGDLVVNLAETFWLLRYTPSLRDTMIAQPWFSDGLSAEEAAFVVVLGQAAVDDSNLFHDLIEDHHTQSRAIRLPLAGDVNIWVFETAPVPRGDDSVNVIARIHRRDAWGLATHGMTSEGDRLQALAPPDSGGCGSRQLRHGGC